MEKSKKMACFYPEDCGQYAVSPMLVAPCYPTKCCTDPPMCYPCLPRCPPAKVAFSYDTKPPCTPPRTPECDDDSDYCIEPPRKYKPPSHPQTCKQPRSAIPESCPTCYSVCKPVKITHCYEKKASCVPPTTYECDEDNDCFKEQPRKYKPPPPTRKQSPIASSESCPTCNSACKSVKTKYVIPCYRYEDGRIVSYSKSYHSSCIR